MPPIDGTGFPSTESCNAPAFPVRRKRPGLARTLYVSPAFSTRENAIESSLPRTWIQQSASALIETREASPFAAAAGAGVLGGGDTAAATFVAGSVLVGG